MSIPLMEDYSLRERSSLNILYKSTSPKIEYSWNSTNNSKEGITISYHYAFPIFIVLFLSIPNIMIFNVK